MTSETSETRFSFGCTSPMWLLLSVTEHEYMQINGSRIYVNESDGVIGPMFLRFQALGVHGF